jgi:hypothetical protein
MDLPANQAASAICGVETIAFGQKMFERASRSWLWRSNRPIFGVKRGCRGAVMGAYTFVVKPIVTFFEVHASPEIR